MDWPHRLAELDLMSRHSGESGRRPPVVWVAGWYRDPKGVAAERWWDGYKWMEATRGVGQPPNLQGPEEIVVDEPSWARPALTAALALALIGAGLQFKSVSLASGDSLLWIGGVLAALAVTLAFIGRAGWALKAFTVVMLIWCVANVWNTEQRLQQTRDQIQQIVNNVPAPFSS